MNKDEYKLYLQSEHWQAVRREKLESTGHVCQKCGFLPTTPHARKFLQVHHLHYRTLHEEAMSDLRALCKHCHEFAHGKRSQPGRGSGDWAVKRRRGDEIQDICLPWCEGCHARVPRSAIDPLEPETPEQKIFRMTARQPGEMLGYCPDCWCAVYICDCDACMLRWDDLRVGEGEDDGGQETSD